MKREEENAKIEAMWRLKKETMICNVIAQRIALQEYLTELQQVINDQIQEVTDRKNAEREKEKAAEAKGDKAKVEEKKEEKKEEMTRAFVEREYFAKWLDKFKIRQPDAKFFLEHEINDIELECNTQSELGFTISTLELFGLPKGYMSGQGHHLDWERKKDENKGKGKKKPAAKGKGPQKAPGKGAAGALAAARLKL